MSVALLSQKHRTWVKDVVFFLQGEPSQKKYSISRGGAHHF